MNNKKLNATRLWQELEDVVVPALRLSPVDRAVYAHLLRHTLLEGKPHLRFSIAWLARGTNLSAGAVRPAVRRLALRGALLLLQRAKVGHLVEVRSPREIRSICLHDMSAVARGHEFAAELADADFSRARVLRESIHYRERGLCFYCLRRVSRLRRCLDHVVPLAHGGDNSYRNLVSCCTECNSEKREKSAKDFLRRLYREERLNSTELAGRLRAVDALAADKLRPMLPTAQRRSARRWRR
ncbi:MAG TPA: HNH endonuclease signature motif containing protein [Candidatus Methylomirabilis sp.]|nr:HNH endonuclease signature motif containing protein [Candidatus Methylomirabilis sp.]